MPARPEIIAHRGASRERPENTLPAFQRAAELGADGVELDVHLADDGVPRVHHDPLPIGFQGPPPPTLAEVLEFLSAAGITGYCELKGPNTARATLAAIRASGVRGAVHAFDHRQVAAARAMDPTVARGVLEVSYPVDPLHALHQVAGRDLWRQWPFIDAALIQAAHAEGARVIAWTVNSEAELARLAALGVDGLCTDDVALARRVLGR